MKRQWAYSINICIVALALLFDPTHCIAASSRVTKEGVFEWTFESKHLYQDPFNDVNVDVVFSKNERSWRVPAFWAGGQRWTVRFAPPVAGEYSYRLESTDVTNPDLNGHEARIVFPQYAGNNLLLQRGGLRVSAGKRYFEYADGTPFFWLGDTWWTGLSDRLSWEGFQKLTADRRTKGFTVIQVVAGLVPIEEVPPSDPGFCNEGGCVWNPGFMQINPSYFDYADRRILHLVKNGLVPAVVGSWGPLMSQLGVAKMKQHWRYIIARYGAYPVIWIGGGEVREMPGATDWTDVARFIRETDPYHHPLTMHEAPPPYDTAILDETLTDFDLIQPSHFGWSSIATEVAQLTKHYSRTHITKPLIVGEIGYENFAGTHLADFQRAAFWLAMLNGAAGFTYGTISVAEAYTSDRPLHRVRWGLDTWEEAMHYPGSHQIGIGAQLLRELPWWKFSPRPAWVTPRGTTLLEPHSTTNDFNIDVMQAFFSSSPVAEEELPLGEWRDIKGNFRLPYAAGVDHGPRVLYLPYFSFSFGLGERAPLPTILGLQARHRYRAYYLDPSTGTKFDLGFVERPDPGALLIRDESIGGDGSALQIRGDGAAIASGVWQHDLVASAKVPRDSSVTLVLRYQDSKNHMRAKYSAENSAAYIVDVKGGVESERLGWTQTPSLDQYITVSAEVRGGTAAISVSDGRHRYTSPIVNTESLAAGSAGLLNVEQARYAAFELRESPRLVTDDHLERKLHDANGRYRGDWRGPGRADWKESFRYASMDEYAKEKHILLDAYRPPRLPFPQDWVLVLDPSEPSSDLRSASP